MLSITTACNAIAVVCYIFFEFVAAGSSSSTTIGKKTCDEFYYYDHGTELCEHCSDICDAAAVRGTEEQCSENCKPYALRLSPPKPDNPVPPQADENGENSGSSSLPLEAQIAIPLLAIMLIGLAGLGLFILRRRKNQNDLKNRKPPEDIELITRNLLNDQVVVEDNSQAVAESVMATQGTEEGSSSAGVQEGVGASESGSQAEGGERRVTQATSSLQDDQVTTITRVKFPIPVSPDGQNASFTMALPHSPKNRHTRPAPQREISQTDSEFNLDSTELKTILPSLSNDSLLTACGGQTTASV